MSSAELAPRDAPLAKKLAVAMARAGINQTQLAKRLGTDRSLVGKWLHGPVKSIKSQRHLRNLPLVLDTPGDYWVTVALSDSERLNRLEAEIAALWRALDVSKRV